jgi:hypothetical protein
MQQRRGKKAHLHKKQRKTASASTWFTSRTAASIPLFSFVTPLCTGLHYAFPLAYALHTIELLPWPTGTAFGALRTS